MKMTIVIFADSVKHGKHCVAGKDITTKFWVRPVSDPCGAELSNEQCLYTNIYGKFIVKPLKIVEINFKQHTPLINQPENYVISDEIVHYLDTPSTLWGVNNRVGFEQIATNQLTIK